VQYFEWVPATWVPASSRALSWINPSYQPLFQWNTQTLDFTGLHDTIVETAGDQYSLLLKTNLLCRYNKIINLVSGVACDCTNSGAECPLGRRDIQIGIGKACPGKAVQIHAPPSELSFDSTSVSECLNIDISELMAVQYKSTQDVSLASQGSTTSSTYSVVSKKILILIT
jgi:hypothetical protein